MIGSRMRALRQLRFIRVTPADEQDVVHEQWTPTEVLSSLTIWTSNVSMQVRGTEVALHVMAAAHRSGEDGHPVLLTNHEARQIRDLLNFATARGEL